MALQEERLEEHMPLFTYLSEWLRLDDLPKFLDAKRAKVDVDAIWGDSTTLKTSLVFDDFQMGLEHVALAHRKPRAAYARASRVVAALHGGSQCEATLRIFVPDIDEHRGIDRKQQREVQVSLAEFANRVRQSKGFVVDLEFITVFAELRINFVKMVDAFAGLERTANTQTDIGVVAQIKQMIVLGQVVVAELFTVCANKIMQASALSLIIFGYYPALGAILDSHDWKQRAVTAVFSEFPVNVAVPVCVWPGFPRLRILLVRSRFARPNSLSATCSRTSTVSMNGWQKQRRCYRKMF